MPISARLDFGHRLDRRVARGDVGFLLHHALDVLDDDDRVVDEQADRQDEPEQRQRVDRIAEQRENPERPEQDDRHRDRRDQRRAPALQEDEHDDDDEDDRLEQGVDDLPDRQLDERRAVERESVFIARRERVRRLLDLRLDEFGSLQRVRPWRELDCHADRGMAVQAAGVGVILGAELDARDVVQPHHRAVGTGLDDDLAELVGRRQSRPLGDDRRQHLRRRPRLRAELAGGDLRVLRLQRGDDVGGRQRHARQLERVEPDPHRILRAEGREVADPGNARDLVLQGRDEIVGDVGRRRLVRRIVQRDDHQEVGVGLGDRHALLLDLLPAGGAAPAGPCSGPGPGRCRGWSPC